MEHCTPDPKCFPTFHPAQDSVRPPGVLIRGNCVALWRGRWFCLESMGEIRRRGRPTSVMLAGGFSFSRVRQSGQALQIEDGEAKMKYESMTAYTALKLHFSSSLTIAA